MASIKSAKNGLNFLSPKGALTIRGKTAQTGRGDQAATLPTIEVKRDRSSSNNRGNVTKVNSLINHQKNGSTRYGNLFKGGQTLELLGSESELMKSKQFADIRVNKLGRKKIPDRYSKSLKTGAQVDDLDSIPSDLEDDQWAEINKYDFELYQEEQRKKRQDFLIKRDMVRNTLQHQIKEQ